MAKWKFPLDDWTGANLESAELMLRQAELHFDNVKAVADKITNRAFSLLTILLPMIYLMTGYLISVNVEKEILLFIFIIIFPLAWSLFLLLKLLVVRKSKYKGWSPVDMYNVNYFASADLKLNKDKQYLACVLNSITDCQDRIKFNGDENIKRSKMLKRSMEILTMVLVLSVTMALVYFLFKPL